MTEEPKFKINLDVVKEQPSLFDVLQYYRHMGLVGEDRTCLIQTLLAIRKQSFGIEALSGAGKSATLDLLANHKKYGDNVLLPQGSVYILQLSSKTAHMYDAKVINRAKLIYIEELQKAGNSLEMTEFLKNLSEGKDVTRSVRDQAHRQNITQTIKKGKGIMYTLALENSYSNDAEMKRRFIVLNTNVSREQTINVVKRKAKERFAKDRLKILPDEKIALIKSHVADCLFEDEKIIYENPFSEFIGDLLPVPDQKIRSFSDHYFNLIEASTLFHKKGRAKFNTGEVRLKKHIIVNLEDIAIVHQLYSEQFMRDVHSIPVMGLEILKVFDKIDYDKTVFKQKQNLTSFVSEDKEVPIKWAAIVDIRDTLKNKLNIILSHKVCKDACDELYNAGYLLKNMNDRTPEYAIADKVHDFTNSIDWEMCFEEGLKNMREYFPELTNDWIKSQTMDNKIGFTDPLTNEKIYIKNMPKPEDNMKEDEQILNEDELNFITDYKNIFPISQTKIQKMDINTTVFNSLCEKEIINLNDDFEYTISTEAVDK